jgi:hypothetical protein
MGKPEGKSPFEGTRHIWEDNIKMNLQEVGFDMAQVRDRGWALIYMVMNLQVP